MLVLSDTHLPKSNKCLLDNPVQAAPSLKYSAPEYIGIVNKFRDSSCYRSMQIVFFMLFAIGNNLRIHKNPPCPTKHSRNISKINLH